MMTIQAALDRFAGKEMATALITAMKENFDDFREYQRRCYDSVEALQEALGNEMEAELEAIQKQTVSNLLYAGYLGLKANFSNYIDPVAGNFLNTDFTVFLQEHIAKSLPEYQKAQEVRDRFSSLLLPEQRKLYEDVTAYVSYLETVGPKLAHYCGYLFGNELLCRIIPGYHPDMAQTVQYRMMLEAYFGNSIILDIPIN